MRILALTLLFASSVQAAEIDPECRFVAYWVAKAWNMVHIKGVQESHWNILPEGYTDEEYATILDIKREAFNDLKALRKRYEKACAEKADT